MPICKANGIDMRYELSGAESAPVLVFSHSLGGSLSIWDKQAGDFEKSFHVLRYDTRGQGESEVTPGPYTFEILGHDLLGLMDALGIARASFCGISMGGMVGQWLAIHTPQRIDNLVLCDTAAKIGTDESWNQRIAAVETEGLPAMAKSIVDRWITPEFSRAHPEERANLEAGLARCSPDGYVACCAALRDADFREDLPQISVRTLVVYGEQDQTATETDARLMAERIAESALVSLPAAHLSNIEAAEQFNAAVGRFLAG